MKRLKCLFFFCVFLLQTVLIAQLSDEIITKRQEIEQFLKRAEIVKSEDIGEGVTRPVRLFLKADSSEMTACWKNPEGMEQGYWEGWQYEIAAYEMDKLLGLNMVPPTVERDFSKKKGSLQLWISGGMSELDRVDNAVQIPASKIVHWNRKKYLARAFDCLIANEDRTQQNIRYSDDWRTVLIDHSRSFRSSSKYTKHLLYGMSGIKGVKLIRELPREFVRRLEGLEFPVIQAAAGRYLKDEEITALLKRRDLLLEEIRLMIEKIGEDKFFYGMSRTH